MRKQRARVSFVVVSWNTRDLVIRCLSELLPQARMLEGEILLVDNGSSDGTADAVALILPEVRVLRNADNLGFARAVNQAIRVSSGSVVALVNSDIVIGAADLRPLVEMVESDRTIGALSSALVDASGRPWTYDHRFPTPLRIALEGILPNALTGSRPLRRGRARVASARVSAIGFCTMTCLPAFRAWMVRGAC